MNVLFDKKERYLIRHNRRFVIDEQPKNGVDRETEHSSLDDVLVQEFRELKMQGNSQNLTNRESNLSKLLNDIDKPKAK